MKNNKFYLNSAVIVMLFNTMLFPQEIPQKVINGKTMRDSLIRLGYYVKPEQERKEIKLTPEEAINYLEQKYRSDIWKLAEDPLRVAIGQLVFYAKSKPFDSIRVFLERYPFDSVNIPPEKFFIFDSVTLKIPNIGLTEPWMIDSLVKADTLGIKYAEAGADTIARPEAAVSKPLISMKDTILLIVTDTLSEVKAFGDYHPFKVFRSSFTGDSLLAAVKALTDFIEARDSTIIMFKGVSETNLPVWLNSRSGDMKRFWLRNEYDDSVTVWVGSAGRNTIGLYLEEGIMFRRPSKHSNIYDAQLDIKQVDTRKLQQVNKLYVKPQYWKYRSEAAFVFNQAMLTNWVKGGENSISTAMDITGYVDYNNKELKITSNNFARLKYGLIKSGDDPVRKNLDLLETNSKLNHKAFGKFDFSATMLFKTQISKGYNYPNDSVPVSKFFNPAVLTLGIGLDYKPNKTTSINVAPLSYKATFVPDTATIDQTKYGVPKDRRSMHEPGGSVQITNEFKPLKTVTITNRLQLFTNYIHNPQNIDIDWEMIAQVKLNWFTDLRFNTHFIFDDDTKTVVKNKDGSPVLGPDGKPKKSARIQFKELLGLSFVFRF
ncbi:MAG: DUF3078 domain-containing protein [Bacteroidales bacterium]